MWADLDTPYLVTGFDIYLSPRYSLDQPLWIRLITVTAKQREPTLWQPAGLGNRQEGEVDMNVRDVLFLLACCATFFVFYTPRVAQGERIVAYHAKYEGALMILAAQNHASLFVGTAPSAQQDGLESREHDKLLHVKQLLTDRSNQIRVLLIEERVAGSVIFRQEKEKSVTTLTREFEQNGLPPLSEKAASFLYPGFKKSDEECERGARIEALILHEAYRNKGYEQKLLERACGEITRCFPAARYICTELHNNDKNGQSMYQSQGFQKARRQPFVLTVQHAALYEKAVFPSEAALSNIASA